MGVARGSNQTNKSFARLRSASLFCKCSSFLFSASILCLFSCVSFYFSTLLWPLKNPLGFIESLLGSTKKDHYQSVKTQIYMIQNQPKWNRVHGIKLELLICWILQFLKNPWRSAVQLVNQTFDKKNKLANPFFLLCFSRMHFTKSKIKSNFILESTTWQEENKIGMISKLSCNFFVLTQNIEPFKYHIRRSSILLIIILM